MLGGVGGTTTPTDGSVTASKLDSSLKDYLEETFTANGSQTVFTLTRAVVGANTLLVTIDGIVQPSSAFTASGTTLTISEVLAANTNVRVVHMGVKAGVYVPANDSITTDMLANSINTDIAAGVAALPKAGGTLTGDVNFNDFRELSFGASDDLRIYTEGTGAFIRTNSGDMKIRIANGNLLLQGADGSDTMAKFVNDGAAELYYDNSKKIETTATGIDVTGNIIFGDNHAIVSDGNDNLVIESSSSEDVIIKAGSGVIEFRDAGESGSPLRAKIDTDGNLLVGTTSAYGTTGTTINQAGLVYSSASGDRAGQFDRTTSDGELVRFSKAGTTVGSINVGGGNVLAIGQGSNYIQFHNSLNSFYASDGSTGRDNAMNIGAPLVRFKDLYLSGTANVDTKIVLDNLSTDYYGTSFQINNTNADFSGALLDMRATSGNVNSVNGRFLRCYSNNGSSEKFHVKGSGEIYTASGILLGGTGAANKLDDYEEGTWLPGLEFASPGSTATTQSSTYTTGSYIKIGQVVTVQFNISGVTFGNGTGNVYFQGLPFTPNGISAYSGKSQASSGHLTSATTSSSYVDILKIYGVNPLNVMFSTNGGGAWNFLNNSNATTVAPNGINGSFTYYTNS